MVKYSGDTGLYFFKKEKKREKKPENCFTPPPLVTKSTGGGVSAQLFPILKVRQKQYPSVQYNTGNCTAATDSMRYLLQNFAYFQVFVILVISLLCAMLNSYKNDEILLRFFFLHGFFIRYYVLCFQLLSIHFHGILIFIKFISLKPT